VVAAGSILSITAMAAERQLTSAPQGHVLTNTGVWSPDSRWIVYDTRSADNVFDGNRIERVEVATGRIETLYAATEGAACGVVTWHPTEPRVVFIHGPARPTPDWTYGMTRRRGVIVDARSPGSARPLDAMNYAPPFTPGALRGGSHVHVFSPDGGAVSFTYEDEVLARLGPSGAHDLNQRTIGVTRLGTGRNVTVARSHPRNHDGDGFTVVVARTVNWPRPGSDEISRAFEECWVPRPGGPRTLAFLGNVTAADGREHAEVFLVELPADLSVAVEGRALEGTETRRPAPPSGTVQRRITFTAGRKFPGVVTAPRHWLRASPDGSAIAFLMKDDAGEPQLWTTAPAGGEPRQVTRNPAGVSSAFSWSPDGRRIAHVMDGSVCVTDVAHGVTSRLTPRAEGESVPLALACVFSPDGRRVAYQRKVRGAGGVFAQIFTVDAHP
jgi:dipeptidyl aminopeptidase/acylaminoacyl peptidase